MRSDSGTPWKNSKKPFSSSLRRGRNLLFEPSLSLISLGYFWSSRSRAIAVEVDFRGTLHERTMGCKRGILAGLQGLQGDHIDTEFSIVTISIHECVGLMNNIVDRLSKRVRTSWEAWLS